MVFVLSFPSRVENGPVQLLVDSSCRLPATTALHMSFDAPLRTLRPHSSHLFNLSNSITVLLHFVSFLNESKFWSSWTVILP